MITTFLSVFVPKNTIIHRLPALVKLAFLIAFIVVTALWVNSAAVAGIIVAFCALAYAMARIPWGIAVRQLVMPLPILVFIGAFQWWQRGWEPALRIVLVLLSCLALANLLTLTTRMEEMMDGLERLLQPAKNVIPTDTIVLAMSLTLRLLPLMLATVNEVLDARKARGLSFSLLAFGTPVLIRSLRRARHLGDALLARGIGD